jgi:hypothetical protein
MQPTKQAPSSGVPGVLPDPIRVMSDADDELVRAHVRRAARPHRSGGWVVERASLLAGGPGFGAAVAWIEAHGGVPELPATARVQRGLHSARAAEGAAPLRFVLPPEALR